MPIVPYDPDDLPVTLQSVPDLKYVALAVFAC